MLANGKDEGQNNYAKNIIIFIFIPFCWAYREETNFERKLKLFYN